MSTIDLNIIKQINHEIKSIKYEIEHIKEEMESINDTIETKIYKIDIEGQFLINKGVHYIYNDTSSCIQQKYQLINYLKFPIVYDKCVYLVANGTSKAFVIPYYIIIKYPWFSNMLDSDKFKMEYIVTPLGNIFLPLEIPNSYYLDILTIKMLRGSVQYIIEKEREHVKALVDYVCVDMK